MLWQSRSSSRIDAAAKAAAASSAAGSGSQASENSNSNGTTVSVLVQQRLCSSTSNLHKDTEPQGGENELSSADHRKLITRQSSCSNDVAVFSSTHQLDVIDDEKQRKPPAGGAKTFSGGSGTSSLGRYASKLKSQLPPIHFGFENKKQSNTPTSSSSNLAAAQNSSEIQRSSSSSFKSTTSASLAPATASSASDSRVGETFGDKISRSIYDITSIERLRNWKAKLPSIRNKHSASPHVAAALKSNGQLSANGVADPAAPASSDFLRHSDQVSSNSTSIEQQIDEPSGARTSGANDNYDTIQSLNASPPSTIPAVNSNQFCQQRQTSSTTTNNSSLADEQRLGSCAETFGGNGSGCGRSHVVAECGSGDSNRTNSAFISRHNSQSQRHVLSSDVSIRNSIGLLLAQTESIMTTTASANERGGKMMVKQNRHEVEMHYDGQSTFGADENKVYEEIDFPGGWGKNANGKKKTPLPPPARITPFSGIPQNKTGEVVRPTAFRPYTTMSAGVSTDLLVNKNANMIHSGSSLDPFHETSGAFAPPLPPPRQPMGSVSPRQALNSTSPRHLSDVEAERYLISSYNNYPQKYPSDTESAGSFYSSYHQRVAPQGPKMAPWQQPTENVRNSRYSPNVKSTTPHTKYIFANGEHDYDLVISTTTSNNNNAKNHPNSNSYELNSSSEFLQKRPLPSLPGQLPKPAQQNGGYNNSQNSQVDSALSAHNYYCTSGSYSSRNSSGIHVTPSPSDSGVVDLETVLKEKESELLQLRQTMEQNEQVVIRVYQEKEERWQEKLREWASRLEQAVSTEQKLLSQIQRLQDDRNELQTKVQSISADKHGLQRKCKELESDLFAIKQQVPLGKDARLTTRCPRCDHASSPRTSSSHDDQENRIDASSSSFKKSPTPADELRNEVDGLRDEVSNLRKSLQEQVYKFTQERKSWEIEKQRVLQYHKILQDSYSQLLRQNGVQNQLVMNGGATPQHQQKTTQNSRVQKT